MTLLTTTRLHSETETPWNKKGSHLKKSGKSSSKSAKAGKGKYVYSFGGRKADGQENLKDLLGGKGANLHGMTRLGLPVPPGFTLTTEVCTYFYEKGKKYPSELTGQVKKA